MYEPGGEVAKFSPPVLAFVDPSETMGIFSQVSSVLYMLVQKPVSLSVQLTWLIASLKTNIWFLIE